MNKKGFLKALMLGFVVVVAVAFMAGNVTAQVLTTQIQLQSSAAAPIRGADGSTDAYLVDNFEYWCNPRNMGWQVTEQCYPYFGYGLGMALRFDCVVDFEEGSRVLDAYRPMSVFLFNTPYQFFTAQKYTQTGDGPIDGKYCLLSFKLRAPLEMENFATFRFTVLVIAGNELYDEDKEDTFAAVPITFIPTENLTNGCSITGVDSVEDDSMDFMTIEEMEDEGANQQANEIMVPIGKQFQDSSWHLVMQNLCDIVNKADNDFTVKAISAVIVTGNQYRLDDIMFTKPSKSIATNGAPHLFRIGPVYAMFMDPYGQMGQMVGAGASTRWIMAEDGDLMINAEYDEDDGLVFTGIYNDNGTDDDVDDDEQYVAGLDPNDPDSYGADEDLKIFVYDEDGERVLEDPSDANTVVESSVDDANLHWIFTQGDSLSAVANIAIPASIKYLDPNYEEGDPYFNRDQVAGWPMYLAQEDGVIIPNTGRANQSNPMYALACALYNAGYEVFPNAMRLMPGQGLVFEDIIITCRVTDGIGTDKETFPISIVNYPVTNHPPLLNDMDDQVFEVMRNPDPVHGVNAYQILALDPDVQDMGNLTYRATLNGIPSYQYGPWMYNIINPRSGLISFRPISEGAFDCIITVEDPRGMFAMGQITIFCTNPGTWFNHQPIILGDMDSPQTIRAGQMFVADEMEFVDPDGDKLYWSCNIGSVGENGIWTFQTMYPGYYLVQITAYDIQGGAATTEFVLHVMPWWSY